MSKRNSFEGIYIDKILVSPIKINLTFQSNSSATDPDSFILIKMMTKALGCAITNIDDAPIKLNGIELTCCFDEITGIFL